MNNKNLVSDCPGGVHGNPIWPMDYILRRFSWPNLACNYVHNSGLNPIHFIFYLNLTVATLSCMAC